jgi:hypothetical protein
VTADTFMRQHTAVWSLVCVKSAGKYITITTSHHNETKIAAEQSKGPFQLSTPTKVKSPSQKIPSILLQTPHPDAHALRIKEPRPALPVPHLRSPPQPPCVVCVFVVIQNPPFPSQCIASLVTPCPPGWYACPLLERLQCVLS